MVNLRFGVGTPVMCNLGSSGWKLGRIIALHYREEHWDEGVTAPYQVIVEEDHALIYVPEDDKRFCREATVEDLRIIHRMDALAELPQELEHTIPRVSDSESQLESIHNPRHQGNNSYRNGLCHCCDKSPLNWSTVELYSEHYRCATRNKLPVTRQMFDLGTVQVGETVSHYLEESIQARGGFLQSPTLTRLPPGLSFSDKGTLSGTIRFDPHRDQSYRVDFVAVSTVGWNEPNVGLIRIEVSFTVEGNHSPDGFDLEAFTQEQQGASAAANNILQNLITSWNQWEQGILDNRETCNRMLTDLRQLRDLLEQHPRLEGGFWWAQLGGFHMNVHKLLENTLFECELYLGHALTFGNPEIRQSAEINLKGCYHKRLLEAARFMWIDGVELMMRGKWIEAAEKLRLAALKKDGWGWAINYGDIWFSESAARLIIDVEYRIGLDYDDHSGERLSEAAQLLEKGRNRSEEGGIGPQGHPWAVEIGASIDQLKQIKDDQSELVKWLEEFKLRTVYWCAQILGGAPPFPPKPRPRKDDTVTLLRNLPKYND